jgi:hypothetical protein
MTTTRDDYNSNLSYIIQANNYGFVFEMRILNNVMVFRFRSDNLFEPNPLNVRKEAIKIVRYFEIINGMRDVMHEVLEALKKA